MTDPLRLLVFDRTCTTSGFVSPLAAPLRSVGLSHAWSAGAKLYRALGRIDAAFGASTWEEALAWLGEHGGARPIAEIQYWGHGKWGEILVDREPLGASALAPGHRLHARLERIRERLLPDAQSLVWLRTCEAFGARAGKDFAVRLADGLGARVAGHTFVIGAIQSGLHGLVPGHLPDWSDTEGLAEGTADAPVRAHGSAPSHPRTISCLEGAIPDAWFA